SSTAAARRTAARAAVPGSGSSSRAASSLRWAGGSGSSRAKGRDRRSPSSCLPSGLIHLPSGYRRPVTRVLVIDDEAPIRLLCRVNLEAEGMDVLEAADGPSGLDVARAERPDGVLLDVMMPGLDGWRVAEHLLEDERTNGIPI